MAMRNHTATPELVAKYINAGMNVLLVGDHGVGKTTVVRKACELLNFKLKEFNGALIDPYVDLIGIPDITIDSNGAKKLSMVGKTDLRDANVIFIDEYNRSRMETRNATMNLVNDHMINDEHLDNLKAVVAACNPFENSSNGDSYDVEAIDPAQLDRFTIKLTMSNKADMKYMVEELGKKEFAKALVQWQNSLDFTKAPYVSPRLTERLGEAYLMFPEKDTLYHVLGDDADKLSVNQLAKSLSVALNLDNNPGKTKKIKKAESAVGDKISDYIKQYEDESDNEKLSEIGNNIMTLLNDNKDKFDIKKRMDVYKTITDVHSKKVIAAL